MKGPCEPGRGQGSLWTLPADERGHPNHSGSHPKLGFVWVGNCEPLWRISNKPLKGPCAYFLELQERGPLGRLKLGLACWGTLGVGMDGGHQRGRQTLEPWQGLTAQGGVGGLPSITA